MEKHSFWDEKLNGLFIQADKKLPGRPAIVIQPLYVATKNPELLKQVTQVVFCKALKQECNNESELEQSWNDEVKKLPPGVQLHLNAFWQAHFKPALRQGGVASMKRSAMPLAKAVGGKESGFKNLVNLCKNGVKGIPVQQLVRQGTNVAIFNFVLSIIDELLAPFKQFERVHNILQNALLAISGALTVVFVATSLMDGASIPVILSGLIVSGVSGYVGGWFGRLLGRGLRSVLTSVFSQQYEPAIAPNEPVIENPQGNNDDMQLPDIDDMQLPDLLPNDLPDDILTEHTCDPPSLGYAHPECSVCLDRLASVGYIHGTVMHVCLCTTCATQLHRPNVCPADNVPVQRENIFQFLNDRRHLPLCPQNHCLAVGTCRICDTRGTHATFSARNQLMLWCANHRPEGAVVVFM